MRIVSRDQWGARPPTSVAWMPQPATYTFLHHTADERDVPGAQWVAAEQAYHMDVQGWADIGYSWLYDRRDRTFYVGRGWGIAGAHTYGYNSDGHALCLLGNFDAGSTLDDQDVAALAEWLRACRDGGHGPAAFTAHCNVNETVCPGRAALARIEEINRMAAAPAPAPAPAWAALTNNDADFAAARDTVHLRLGLPILGAADAAKAAGALYVGAFDAPARPWERHLQTVQVTGQGADRTRALLDWWVRAVQAVGHPPL